jgi:hypothetical protein
MVLRKKTDVKPTCNIYDDGWKRATFNSRVAEDLQTDAFVEGTSSRWLYLGKN